ncbi:urea transporter [Staphylococcus simulans]|uniref:urea transporter n=1 Tax=Staphylococcus simulans TaxID=1286 RepID=UPI000D1F22F3|nr:urea transporter [Staphylococcus simulans]MDY5059638.1 urea transporter [Staphylococcus simulans]PTJ14570.1 urea transporter [Staphylococcus simulans]
MRQLVDVVLKNISQVLLLNNAWTGLFILAGLFVADWKVGLAALLSSLIAYVLAPYTNYSKAEIREGLAGFNPVLTGVALTIFLVPDLKGIGMTALAVVLTLPLGAAFRHLLSRFDLPMLTMPYVFISWMFLFMSFQFEHVNAGVNILPSTVREITFSHHAINGVMTFLDGFSEIFLVKSTVGGLLILIGIFIASKRAGLFSVVANIIGVFVVMLFGANHDDINTGLYGYNVILVILALGVTFKETSVFNKYLSMLFGIFITVVVHAGLVTWLKPFGLPVFTLPFIVATWLMLMAGKPNVMPVEGETENK